MHNKHNIFIRNLLFALILIYLAQGILYASGSLISQSSLLVYLLVSAFYGFKFFDQKEKNIFGNLLLLFLLMNVIYWMFSPRLIKGYDSFINLKNNVFFILTFFPFYYLSKNNVLTAKSLKIFFVLIFCIYTLQYFLNLKTILEETGRENIVNNGAYYFVSLLPLMGIFFRNKLIYLSLFSISLYMVILGAKRGAILSFAIGSIIAFYFLLKDSEKRNRIRNNIAVLLGLCFLIYYGYRQFFTNAFAQKRFESALEGNSSGRDIIYASILNKWYNSDNLLNLFFGYGFNGSLKMGNGFAHNDWLEILSGQGLLGAILYLIIMYSIWKYYSKNKIFIDVQGKSILLSVLSIWFLQSLFSSVYGGFFTFTYVLTLGYIMGSTDIILLNRNNYQAKQGQRIIFCQNQI